MNESKRSASAVTAGMIGGSVAGTVLGVVLVVLGIGFDWGGFSGGLAIGAGIGLAMAGMFFCGLGVGTRRAVTRTMWRPSEDIPQ